MVCTVYSGGTQYVAWYAWAGFAWSLQDSTTDSDWLRSSTVNGQEHVAFAVAYSVTFTPVDGSDYFKGATEVGPTEAPNWARDPTPAQGVDDYTTRAAIPEFSNVFIPIASVALIVGNRIRNKKNYQQ